MTGPWVRCAALAFALLSAAAPAQARRLLGPPRSGPQGAAPDAASTPIVPAHLSYCGGRVLSQAQIVAVLWGPPESPVPASASCNDTFANCLTAWYTAFVQSPQFDWLDEYQTTLDGPDGQPGTNQHILPPSFYGVVQITPANTASVVGEIDVENELVSQIEAGHLPAPGAADETIYEVHFPLTVDPSDPGSQACDQFCAYHDSWHSNILGTNGIIAILPSHMPPGYSGGRDCAECGEKSDWFANLGGSMSHESIEAITDPDVGSAGSGCAPPLTWSDGNGSDAFSVHGEIGDMCEGIPDTSSADQITEVTLSDADGGLYTVQREWSNQYSSCLTAIGQAFTIAGPDGGVLFGEDGSATATLTSTAPVDAASPLPIALTAHGVPASGVTVTFAPQMLNAGESATMTVALGAGAKQTGFALGIAAESGTSQAQTVISFAAPDFNASLGGSALDLTAGGAAATLALTTSVATGAARGYTIAASGIPGVTVTPAVGALGTPATLSFSAAAGTPSSDGTLSVDITSVGVTHSLPVQIQLAGDGAALSAPAGLSVQPGGSVRFTVASRTTSGNPQALALAATGLPAGATIAFAPAQITSGQSSTATLTMPASTPLFPLDFTITGQGPVAEVSVSVPLALVAPGGGCASPGLAPWALLGLLGLSGWGSTARSREKS